MRRADPSTVQTCIRVPRVLLDQINEEARTRVLSRNHLINLILEKGVRQLPKGKPCE